MNISKLKRLLGSALVVALSGAGVAFADGAGGGDFINQSPYNFYVSGGFGFSKSFTTADASGITGNAAIVASAVKPDTISMDFNGSAGVLYQGKFGLALDGDYALKTNKELAGKAFTGTGATGAGATAVLTAKAINAIASDFKADATTFTEGDAVDDTSAAKITDFKVKPKTQLLDAGLTAVIGIPFPMGGSAVSTADSPASGSLTVMPFLSAGVLYSHLTTNVGATWKYKGTDKSFTGKNTYKGFGFIANLGLNAIYNNQFGIRAGVKFPFRNSEVADQLQDKDGKDLDAWGKARLYLNFLYAFNS